MVPSIEHLGAEVVLSQLKLNLKDFGISVTFLNVGCSLCCAG